MHSVLDTIDSPLDLKKKSMPELTDLSGEIRREIINIVAENGGHLASNLGIIELTIALHYAFDLPKDKIVWDVSHQSYTHKILTGRRKFLKTLRKDDGCSGFTSIFESEYDSFGAGHAGTAISAALGMAAARDRLKSDEKIIALLGDGSLTNGMSLEGLNNVVHTTKNFIIILNDNKMSIAKNVGGITYYLNRMIQRRGYNKLRNYIKNKIASIPKVGLPISKFTNRFEESIKNILVPGVFFEELGIRYLGPIDGHNISDMIHTFSLIKEFNEPVIVHVLTEKGHGFEPAQTSPEYFHGLGKFNPCTGEVEKKTDCAHSFSEAFGNAAIDLANKHDKVVAITAAMCSGVGLTKFSKLFPDRFFDAGIAEGHATVFAAGLAIRGLRPLLALYSTFLQRSMSSVYHDICLQNLPVIICADRSGIVDDGPTHHGIYDVSYMRSLPNLSIIYPSVKSEMYLLMEMAYNSKSPVLIKYPKGTILDDYPINKENYSWGKSITIQEGKNISIWTTGIEYRTALSISKILEEKNLSTEIINTVFLKPFDVEKLKLVVYEGKMVVTIEDNSVCGGLASAVDETLINCKHNGVLHFGWNNDEIVEHGTSSGIREKHNLTSEHIAKKIFNYIKGKE